MDNSELLKNPQTKAIILLEPFLFEHKMSAIQEKLVQAISKNKYSKMIYVVSIMNDYSSLSKLAFINPLIRIMMLFCITSETELMRNIRIQGKEEPIDPEKFKKVFYLSPCTSLIQRLNTLPDDDE